MQSNVWQPSASVTALQQRAALNKKIRDFFYQQQVMEVETPIVNRYAVADQCLQPFSVSQLDQQSGYLHTSPEYAMKRLLAAGSGDIYQLCKVFRASESGKKHNPEFTMLEWYRLGLSMNELMQEVLQFLQHIFAAQIDCQFVSYRQAMMQHAQLDPFSASDHQVAEVGQGIAQADLGLERDGWLDIIMSHKVEPSLAKDQLTFIYHYPSSQAALAKVITDNNLAVAERFEVYYQGIELANGYHELTDPDEQLRRFELEQQSTQREIDQYFCQALQAGLPQCSGVAIGVDRLLMLQHNYQQINQVISFDQRNA